MATRDEIYAAIRNADASGDSASVQKLAAYLETLPIEVKAQEKAPDPSEGGGTLSVGPFDTGIKTSQGVDRFLSGMGAGMSSMARGAGQLVGLSDQASVDEARRLEAPLKQTGAGTAGDIAGRVALAVPTAFIPGVNTYAGAAAVGAGTGALTTEGGLQDRAAGAGFGGVGGTAGLAIGRGLVGMAQGVRAMFDPLTHAGGDRIASRTLQQFAGGPQQAAQAATNLQAAQPLVQGAAPTAGEVSGNAGIAQLERALRQNPELAQAFTERLQGNRAAMIRAVEGLAGNEQQMAAAVAAREAAAAPLYAASRAQNILPDQAFAQLSQRPAMQQAMARAEQIMNEGGGQATPGQFLHSVKMALDDMLQTGPQRGVGGAEAGAVRTTRDEFVRWLENASPEYGQARQAYSAASAPINQMQIGQLLRERLVPALGDFGADTRTTAATFANALRNGDQTAAQATGRANATLENTLTPDQLQMLRDVATQLGRRATADELGRIPGSNTAQNLVSQNVLRQLLGPLGLPDSVGENILAQTLMRPIQFAGRLAEPRILNRLAELLMDPAAAGGSLGRIPPPPSNALAQIGRSVAVPVALQPVN